MSRSDEVYSNCRLSGPKVAVKTSMTSFVNNALLHSGPPINQTLYPIVHICTFLAGSMLRYAQDFSVN